MVTQLWKKTFVVAGAGGIAALAYSSRFSEIKQAEIYPTSFAGLLFTYPVKPFNLFEVTVNGNISVQTLANKVFRSTPYKLELFLSNFSLNSSLTFAKNEKIGHLKVSDAGEEHIVFNYEYPGMEAVIYFGAVRVSNKITKLQIGFIDLSGGFGSEIGHHVYSRLLLASAANAISI